MRLFYDCEFLENGHYIDLLSIGMVRENGEELYLVVHDQGLMQRAANHDWLRENVLPSLPIRVIDDGPKRFGFPRYNAAYDDAHPDMRHVRSKPAIADAVRDFIQADPDPQLWAWYGAYDHVALCQLFGRMIDLPKGIPMWTNDLKQEAQRLGNPRVPQQEAGQHNALADAQHNQVIARFLDEHAAGR